MELSEAAEPHLPENALSLIKDTAGLRRPQPLSAQCPHGTGGHGWGRASTCIGLLFSMLTSFWLSCSVFEVPLQNQI